MNKTTFFPETDQIGIGHDKNSNENLALPMKPYLLLIIFIQALLSTVGNIIIFLMTITMPTLRKKTCVYFILCLSFSDILFGSASIDHYFQSNLDVIPSWRCLLTAIVSLSAFLISLIQTFLICLERALYMIHFPHSSPLLTDKTRTLTVAGTWVVCVVYICVLVVISSRHCSIEDKTIEDFVINCNSLTYGFSVVFVPIYICVILQYIFILYKIRKLNKSVHDCKFNPENPNEAAIQNSSLKLLKNIFKTMSIFVVMYVVSFGPFVLFFLRCVSGNPDRIMFMVVVILLSLNGLYSPLLYIWRFKEVRNLFEC